MSLRQLCPDGERLWAAAATSRDAVQSLEQHLRECIRCGGTPADVKESDGPVTLDLMTPDPPPAGLMTTSLPGRGRPEPGALKRPGQFGRYRVEKVLGRGGMGYVVRAYDPVLDRLVAIKVLYPHSGGSGANAAFLKEARAAAGIHCDHVVPVFTADEEAGAAYLVMQYVPGGTLQDRLDGGKPFTRAELADIARQAVRGLATAHAKGLVHRDVKPSNLLIEPLPDGGRRVRVADFGLAHAALAPVPEASGCVAGTPAYMPPEQARGRPVDHRADLYSLGVVLFQMVTGRLPFVCDRPDDLLRKHISAPAPRPSDVAPGCAPPDLERLIVELLNKDPAARPQTAAEVLARLDRVADGDLLTTAERARLAALRGFRVLDTDPDPALDDLTQLAAYICGTPIALVTLVDEDRQWFKSRVGLTATETARNLSFCSHAVASGQKLVVNDTVHDPRFQDHPVVRNDPGIRFYAGMPLTTRDGFSLGTLCVADKVPRELTPEQLAALAALGRLALSQLELRRDLMVLREKAGDFAEA